jgi:hypothetical protein
LAALDVRVQVTLAEANRTAPSARMREPHASDVAGGGFRL